MEKYAGLSLITRYGFLLAIGLVNIFLGDKGIFYTIFSPLTIQPVFFFFRLIYEGATTFGADTIFIRGFYATLIPACIAGSAYYLLLILNVTTPMALKKRAYCLVYVCALFLVLNIARILLFGVLLSKGYQYFDITHLAVWYFGSTILVAGIWFSAIFLFKIREAPVLTDVRTLLNEIQGRKSGVRSAP